MIERIDKEKAIGIVPTEKAEKGKKKSKRKKRKKKKKKKKGGGECGSVDYYPKEYSSKKGKNRASSVLSRLVGLVSEELLLAPSAFPHSPSFFFFFG